MNTIDIILIILLSAVFLAALIGTFRGRKHSCCGSCSGCRCCGDKCGKTGDSLTE